MLGLTLSSLENEAGALSDRKRRPAPACVI